MSTRAIPFELLERERELQSLTAAIDGARERAGSVALVVGPPGVGKSGLLARARAVAREFEMQVLEARGAQLERGFAFGVVRQLFEHAVMALSSRDRGRVLDGAARLAAGLLGIGGQAGADAGDAEFGALHGLYWLTVNLADRGPILLSIDDAHWADSGSLQFIGYLARRLEGLPVVLLATGRAADPEGNDLWRALAEDPVAEVLRPQPLSAAGASEMVRRRLGPDAADDFCLACHRATGGNPLFLRELVVALADAEIEPISDAAAAVTDVGPPAVARFLLHRLERLGPAATALARALAVLGGDADPALAARAAALDPDAARAAADVLVRAEVFAADYRLRFVHPIVQAAIYEDLLPGERAERHRSAARVLDAAGGSAERVAAQIVRAGPSRDPRWLEVLRQAARDAIGRAAPAAAATYLRRALEEHPDERQRDDLLCELAGWEVGLQQTAAAREHLQMVLGGPGPPAVRARAPTWLGISAIGAGTPESARAAHDAILSTLQEVDGEAALALEAVALHLVRVELTLYHLAEERLVSFQRRAAGNPRFEAIARIHAAAGRMLRGDSAAEVANETEAVLDSCPVPDPWPLGIAIQTLILTDRFAVAGSWLERAMQAARTLGLGQLLAGVHAQRSKLAFMRGAVGDAQLDAATALELADPGHFALPRIVGIAIQAGIERGELDAAQELADRYAQLFEAERVFQEELVGARGRLRIARDDLHGGVEDLIRCQRMLVKYDNRRPAEWRADAVAALAQLGERDHAERLARDGLDIARRFGAPRALCRALRSAGTTIGGAEGLGLLEEAVTVGPRSAASLEAAYAQADLGRELIGQRRRREGREILRTALPAAVECGASALADRIRGDLGAGGGRRARLELSGIDALTPAERRICDLAASGLANREVAQTLFVTEKTIELHLTNAYRKLGIRSRHQLPAVLPASAGSA